MILNKDQAIAIRDIACAMSNVNANIGTITFDDSDAHIDIFTSGELMVYTLNDNGFFVDREAYESCEAFAKFYKV